MTLCLRAVGKSSRPMNGGGHPYPISVRVALERLRRLFLPASSIAHLGGEYEFLLFRIEGFHLVVCIVVVKQ